MINVVIADDQAIFRAGIAKVLAVEEDLRIVGQPQSLEQLLNAVEKLRAHVLLISKKFVSSLPKIYEIANPNDLAVLVVADNGENAAQYLRKGARGVVYRSVSAPVMVQAVRKLAHGGKFEQEPSVPGLAPAAAVGTDFVGARVTARLTAKELRVIASVVQGFKNREIAQQLGTSEQVVKNLLRVVYDKCGVSDRLELALFVIHHRTLAQATSSPAPDRTSGSAEPETYNMMSGNAPGTWMV